MSQIIPSTMTVVTAFTLGVATGYVWIPRFQGWMRKRRELRHWTKEFQKTPCNFTNDEIQFMDLSSMRLRDNGDGTITCENLRHKLSTGKLIEAHYALDPAPPFPTAAQPPGQSSVVPGGDKTKPNNQREASR